MKKITLLTMLFSVMLTFGQTTTINFDVDANWIPSADGSITSYQNGHSFVDGVFSAIADDALRQGNGGQDGFPGALGDYAWRLRNNDVTSWTATIASGGVDDFSVAIRRWDGSPSPDFNLEYSVDGGTTWEFVALINNASLNDASDWVTFTGSVQSSEDDILVRIVPNSSGERIMIDDFSWSAFSSAPITPTTSAPTPVEAAEDVISIYSDAYTDVSVANYDPNWGQPGHTLVNTTFDPTGTGTDFALAYPNFTYQGTDIGANLDLSDMDFLHVDIWVAAGTDRQVKVSPINNGTGVSEILVEVPLTPGSWNSVTLDKSDFIGMTWDSVFQLKFDGQFNSDGTANTTPFDIYVDNIYFSQEPIVENGEDCSTAFVVDQVPYTDSGDTANTGNNYLNTDRPTIDNVQYSDGTGSGFYLNGDDTVYAFTPDESGIYNFELTNIGSWVGFWLFEGCEPFSNTVAYHTSSNSNPRILSEINLTAGQTYYVVISTFPTPDSTTYTLDISQITCPTPQNLVTSNLSTTSVDLAWDSVTSATEYEWLVFNSGDDPEVDSPLFSGIVDDGSSQANISGLASATTYDAYVVAVCSDTDESDLSSVIEFTTECDSFAAPFSENFSSSDTPNCWSESGDNSWDFSTSAGFAASDVEDHTDGGGTNFAWMDGSDNTDGEVSTLTSPFIDISGLTEPELRFFAFSNNVDSDAVNILEVEFYDGSVWNNVLTQSELLGADWVEFNIDLTSFTISGDVQIRFTVTGQENTGDTFHNDILIDDVEIDEPISCPAVVTSTIAVSNISSTTADITWVEEPLAVDGYEWFVYEAGDSPENDTAVANGSTTDSATVTGSISGLTPITDYDVYLQAICGDSNESELSSAVSFTTACSTVSAPYNENFDADPTSIPDCWTQGVNNAEDWEFADTPTGHIGDAGSFPNSSASGNGFAWVDDSGDHNLDTRLESPFIDVSSLTVPAVSFYFISNNEGETNVDFRVEVWDGAAWNEVFFSNENSENGAWEEVIVDISALNITGDIQLAFIVDENNGTDFDDDLAIDDVSVDELPTCLKPENVQISNISNNSIDLSWDAESSATSGYTWFIYEGGSNPETDTEVLTGTTTSTNVTISNFSVVDVFSYDVYVQSNCGDSDSLLSLPESFTIDVCDPSNQCNFTFELTDTFGDGWNGNTMDVIQAGVTVATLGSNFTDGSTTTETVALCDGVDFELYWNAGGSFAGEVGVEVSDPNGISLFLKSPGSGSQDSSLFTGLAECPSCLSPTAFSLDLVGTDSVDFSWTGNDGAVDYSWFIFESGDSPETDTEVDSGITTDENATSVAFLVTGVNSYDIYIQTNCSNNEESALIGPFNFEVALCDVEDQCVYTFELTDSFGDGWNGNTMDVIQDGTTVATIGSSFTNGSTLTENISLCSDIAFELYWNAGGSFAGEVGVEIINPDGLSVYTNLPGDGSQDSSLFTGVACPAPIFANAQIIHNSPDPAASMVDVYVDGALALDDFEFRTATEFIELPAGVEIDIDIAPSTSADVTESIYTMSTTLAEDEMYTIVANGVLDPTQFDSSVNTIDFVLDVFTGSLEVSGDPAETDVLVHHGSPDAPTVDIVETSVPAGILVDDISYSEFDGYLNLASGDYTIDVTTADGSTVVASYEAPLATLQLEGQALTVIASGFLDPTANQNGPAFGLWVALPDGGDLIELPVASSIPSNDNVCDAIPLTVGATSTGDAYTNVNATAETDEPVPACFNDGINGSVWFTFVAPASGEVEVSTDILGATLVDTEIAVYESPTDCSDLSTFGADLECDQDGGNIVGFGYTSIIEIDALVPGDTYYVQVDQWGTADPGTFGIEVKDTNPPCPEPTNLAISNITDNSADLSWDDVTEATIGFEWQVFESGDNPETDSPIVNGTTGAGETLANIIGLTSNTTYDAYVLSDCDTDGTSILSSAVTFSTLCDTVYTVPFNETFNSDSDSENCWIVLDENGDGDAWNLDYTLNPFEGNEVAALNTDFNSGNNNDWLISPTLDLTGNDQLTFQVRVQSSGEPNDFEILLSTSGTETADFTEVILPLDSYDNVVYQEITVDLSSYTGEVHIAWHVPQGGLDGWRLYVDDVNVSEIPECFKPTNVQVDNIAAFTADISWDDEPTASVGYEWFVYNSGDDPETDTPVASGTTNAGEITASVSGLESDTDYDVYVQSDCDTDGVSDLSNVVSFTTEVSCLEPVNLIVDSSTQDGANISWDEEPNAANGYNWFVFEAGNDPETDTPLQTGNTDSSTFSVTIAGLSGNTEYDFYVQSDCGTVNGVSVLSDSVSFFTLPQAVIVTEGVVESDNYCYGNNDFQQWLFTSDDGSPLVIDFTQGSVEANTFAGGTYDDLVIYDGTDQTGTVLYDSDLDNSDVGDLSVLSFVADSGSMFITLESDFTNSCDTGQQTEIFFDVFIEVEPVLATAQIIHNSPDPAASMVDVYVDGVLAVDDFEFRTATEFIELPADVVINIDIAPSTSADVTESIYNMSTTLAEDEMYTIVANGVLDPTQFDSSVNTIDFNLDVFIGSQTVSGDPAETNVLVHHGSPDAPTVDVVETSVPSGILVDDISYSEFEGYLNLPTGDYTIDVTTADGSTVVASYEAPLATLQLEGQALTVVASGFLDPIANQNGPEFGLWVALPDGGDLIELALIPEPVFARAQIIHNSPDPAATMVDVYLNGVLAIDDFEFRTATEFIDVPAEVAIDVDIAPSTSADVSESIYNLNTTLVENETYIIVADGVLDPSQFDTSVNSPIDFGLEVYTGGLEVASDPGDTDVLVHHGAPDVPAIDVVETSVPVGPVFTDLAYTDFQGYTSFITDDYIIDINGPAGLIESYEVPLDELGLNGAAIVVVASGFSEPVNNQGGPEFGLWVALASGGPLVELPIDIVSTDNFNANNFSFYPNPVKDMLNIKTSLNIDEITVFNMLGQTVVKVKPNAANPSLSLENLQAGAYLVKVESNGNSKLIRIIKE
ncbi:DUF4397 domain-containing protein [Psychroflexus aestuariivivens]|uniref:DUF4397 domain-containing protein n=1 Tax=Psychroflexus aestuariivivens TaxID=1795040 RepID=UPI001F004F37|nr:DUF4397 domain-containing protein [Psychroflexus aestuariivivens]